MYLVGAGPETDAALPTTSPDGGAYLCVLNGSLLSDAGTEVGRSLAWRGPHSSSPVLFSGSGGVEVLVLQFPAAQ